MNEHDLDVSVAELETLDAPDFWSGLLGVAVGVGIGLAIGLT